MGVRNSDGFKGSCASRLYSKKAPISPLWACGATTCRGLHLHTMSGRGWTMPRGRPHALCQVVGACLGEMGMTGPASTQAMADGVPLQGGRGDALLRLIPQQLT